MNNDFKEKNFIINKPIFSSYSSLTRLVLLTEDDCLLIYDTSKLEPKLILTRNFFLKTNKIFVNKDDIYYLSYDKLFDINNFAPIFEFKTNSILKVQLFEDTLLVVTQFIRYTIHLGKIISNEQFPMSFPNVCTSKRGQYLNFAGYISLFYENKAVYFTSLGNIDLKLLNQINNVGYIEIKEKEETSFKFFRIKENKCIQFDSFLKEARSFDHPTKKLMVFPDDNKFIFVSTKDMKTLIEYDHSFVTKWSTIHCTHSGIFIITDKEIILLNK